MNNQRRKQIKKLQSQLENIKGDIEAIRDEEHEYYDNIPENLQGGDKHQTSGGVLDFLDSSILSMDEAIDSLGTALA